MNNRLFILMTLVLLAFASCTVEPVEVVDPDFGEQIKGTYTMDTYVTHSGESTPNAEDKVVITRVSDTEVDVAIDYAVTSTGSDVNLNGMTVTESDGIFSVEKTFSNATADGSIDGNTLTLNVDYTNGNFARITATK